MNLPSKLPSISALLSLPEMLSERIPDNMKTMSVTLRHVLVVSHAVTVERVRAALPLNFEPDTLRVGGQSCAVLQTVCAFNDNFRYTPLARPALDFWQVTYRVLTRGPLLQTPPNASTPNASTPNVSMSGASLRDPGAFVFKSLIGARAAWAVQRAVAGETEYADFNVITRGQVEQGDYSSYLFDAKPPAAAEAAPDPPTQIAARTLPSGDFASQVPPAPFAARDKMTAFLLQRPHTYQKLSVGENIAALIVEHAPMTPVAAELVPVGGEVREARFGVWEQMGLLSPQEMLRPYAVLIQPEVAVTIHAPRLIKLAAASP